MSRKLQSTWGKDNSCSIGLNGNLKAVRVEKHAERS